MSPKDVDEMANSVDPAWSDCSRSSLTGSTLFAQTCLSKNLGSLQQTVEPGLVDPML